MRPSKCASIMYPSKTQDWIYVLIVVVAVLLLLLFSALFCLFAAFIVFEPQTRAASLAQNPS